MTAQPARIGADVRTIKVPVRELTAEAFAPYGQVSASRESFTLDFGEEEANLCHVRLEPQPFHVNFLCRHVRSTQAYMPLGGAESIIIVAPAGDLKDKRALPDLTRIAAFRLKGDRAVNLHRGTWHRAPMPLGAEAEFMVLDREGTLDDCDLVDLRYNLSAALDIQP